VTIGTKLDVRVETMMEAPVRTIQAGASLRETAALLRDLDMGTLVITAGDDIVGIVSERDIVHAIADGTDPDAATVDAVMSRDPRYATIADDVRSALQTMIAARIRHLPVIDEGEVVGIVSVRDLVVPLVG
jgi:CBS domain-containing protein